MEGKGWFVGPDLPVIRTIAGSALDRPDGLLEIGMHSAADPATGPLRSAGITVTLDRLPLPRNAHTGRGVDLQRRVVAGV